MALDLKRVDQNLQIIRQIEASWSLPPLPDHVKLDLAGNGIMDPQALQGLLTGLEQDIDNAQRREPFPTRDTIGASEVVPTRPQLPQPGSVAVGRFIAGITGQDMPQVLDTQAAQRLKQKLVNEGLLDLPASEIASTRWLPEYSYAAAQYSLEEMSRRFQGNKPGSISVEQILNLVDDWLSPRGLYRAAVELDLWWDVDQISEEWRNWGAKLQAWREDPWNLRKLADLLGPVDDIIFPALNIALMFTGVGEIMGVGRALFKGLKGAEAVAGLYRGSKGLRFMQEAEMVADINRFMEASFLSKHVSRIPRFGEGMSNAMQRWRQLDAVIMAKKVNQQVLKLGFTGKLEQLIDADRGGASLSHFVGDEALGEQVHQIFSNPILDWAVDLALFPPNIYSPGVLARPASELLDWTRRGFTKVSQNQELTKAWYEALARHIREVEGEEVYKAFRDAGKKDVRAAIRDHFFGGDEEVMGTTMGYVTIMAGVDAAARRAAQVASGQVLGELDSSTLNAFHEFRNQYRGKLKVIPLDDLNEAFNHIAKYGANVAEDAAENIQELRRVTAPTRTRSADKFYERRDEIMSAFQETRQEMAQRAGAVPEGAIRFVGRRDPDTGVIDWRPLRGEVDDDPFFVDIFESELRDVLGDQADAIIRGERALPEEWARRNLQPHSVEGTRLPRLSEAANVRAFKEDKLRELRTLIRHHNDLRAKVLAEILNDVDPELIAQYVYEVIPTFGNMPKFLDATTAIQDALMRGDLDSVRIAPPISPTGRRISPMPQTPSGVSWSEELFNMVLRYPDESDLSKMLNRSIFSPFAREVDPVFSQLTVAATDTVTKQDALAFAAEARLNIHLLKTVRRIKKHPKYREVFDKIAARVGATREAPSLPAVREFLAEAMGSVNERMASRIRALARMLDESNVTLDDIERTLTQRLIQIDNLPDWAEKYRVPTFHGVDVDDVVERVQEKVRELHRQSNYMASAVEDVPEYLEKYLAERGYKLVYGVDFHQPADFESILPEFARVTTNQIRRMRMGQFFQRQEPEYISKVKVRKVREALHKHLRRVPDEGGVRLNLGDVPDSTNADLNGVLADLWDILDDTLNSALLKLDDLEGSRLAEKISTRVSLSRVPLFLDRLASDLGFNKFVQKVMAKGYSRKQAQAMYRALQESQHLGWRMHGLYAIETKLRSTPNLLEALRGLGTLKAGDQFRRVRPIRGTIGLVTGGYAGGVLAEEMGVDQGSTQGLLMRAGGAVLGAALGGSPHVGIPGVSRLVSSLEYSDKLRYFYLADYLANIRDMLRFSISPLFDASRYAEGFTLHAIADLPQSLKNPRFNPSPKSFRKMLAKEFMQNGIDKDTAIRMAKEEWGRVQDQFAAVAKGYRDFDWEVIDSVGRRFSSVGILGFSPAHWMASTWGFMVRGGADPRAAYEAVRNIYTYGITGRSAAELSMNFIFFPFSYTKKVVGHLNDFFMDDLSRLVVLHDALAVYQALNERYDLSQEWRDRFPILERAHRLNILAYGIGLGEFGGINAPYIQTIGRLPGFETVMEMLPGPPEIVNAFIPQMVPLRDEDDANALWDMTRRLMPIMNDINTLWHNMADQLYVATSPEFLSRRAESRRAWEEFRAFQEQIKSQLEPHGITWAQAMRRPEFKLLVDQEKARLLEKYPGWRFSWGDGLAEDSALELEKVERLHSPQGLADRLLAEYENLLDQTKQVLTAGGLAWSRPEEWPPELFDALRRVAIEYAEQDPQFLRLYNRFYRDQLGDIAVEA